MTDNLHIIQQLDINIACDWSYRVLDISDNNGKQYYANFHCNNLAQVVNLWVENLYCVLTGSRENDQLNTQAKKLFFKKLFFISFTSL